MKNSINKLVNYENKWVIDVLHIEKFLSSNQNITYENSSKHKSFFLGFFLILGFFRIIELYLRQNNYEDSLISKETKHLIAETSHGYKGRDLSYRHNNYFLIFNPERKIDYLIFDCFNKRIFTKLMRLSLKEIYSHLKNNYEQLNSLYNRINSSKLRRLILFNNAKNLGTYSYFCALFEKLSREREDVSLFHGGAVFISHAASLCTIKNHYLSHGLIPTYDINPLTLPKYDSIHIYSEEEKKHIEKLLPNTLVKMYPFRKIKTKTKKIICFVNPTYDYIYRVEGDEAPENDPYKNSTEINKLIEVIKLLKSFNYKIILKNHPSFANSATIDKISSSYNAELIKGNKISALELIYKEKPTFTVNWESTTVCESLNTGVIPLCLTDPRKRKWIDLYIYPFKKRALFWEKKEDKELFRSLLERKESYERILSSLNFR
tara:strand:+ start:1046 stop:2347 length:1302 start_codon:yes stop_codon:yes gene_type:complete